jgi:hypothetical protein
MIASLKTIRPFVIAFVSGAMYEGLAVIWVHRATGGSAMAVALISGLQALATVAGLGEAVKSWRVAPCFLLGYSVGAYVAMILG